MTTLRRTTSSAAVIPGDGVRPFTVALFIAVLCLLLYYVIQVNSIAAQTWNVRDLRQRMSVLRDEHNTLVAHQTALDDRDALQQLAVQHAMVPAGAIVYLTQNADITAAR